MTNASESQLMYIQ